MRDDPAPPTRKPSATYCFCTPCVSDVSVELWLSESITLPASAERAMWNVMRRPLGRPRQAAALRVRGWNIVMYAATTSSSPL
jgi:hypothetical protein